MSYASLLVKILIRSKSLVAEKALNNDSGELRPLFVWFVPSTLHWNPHCGIYWFLCINHALWTGKILVCFYHLGTHVVFQLLYNYCLMVELVYDDIYFLKKILWFKWNECLLLDLEILCQLIPTISIY